MNLLEFKQFLNGLPDEDLNVYMVVGRNYQFEEDKSYRLDNPILSFYIDPAEKEAIFEIHPNEEGFNYLNKMLEENKNKQNATT